MRTPFDLPELKTLPQADYEGSRSDLRKRPTSKKAIVRALREVGVNVDELVQGNGYLYFVGDDFGTETSVYVCWLNDLSLEGWLAEARGFLSDEAWERYRARYWWMRCEAQHVGDQCRLTRGHEGMHESPMLMWK
jgi:hypothetical protein